MIDVGGGNADAIASFHVPTHARKARVCINDPRHVDSQGLKIALNEHPCPRFKATAQDGYELRADDATLRVLPFVLQVGVWQ